MKKLFTNDKFFPAMVLLAAVGETSYALIGLLATQRETLPFVQLLLRVACVVALYFSYQKHRKNVMKGLMGALLMGQLMTAVSTLSDIALPIEKVTSPLFAALSLLLFVNHFIINAERKPSVGPVRMNQWLVVLLVLNNLARGAVYFAECGSGAMQIALVADVFGFVGMSAVVVCIESRLDAYRLNREVAGWTTEKGYPEGYIHEYEKKDN